MQIVDDATLDAVAGAAVGFDGVRESGMVYALADAFGNQAFTVRIFSAADVLLAVVNRGSWVVDVSSSPRRMSAGAQTGYVFSESGTPARCVFRTQSGVDIFECTAGIGSGEVSFLAGVAAGVAVETGAITMTAPTGLDADAGVALYAQTLTATTSASLPVTFVAAFARGDVPSGQTVTADVVDFQAVAWSRYDDGSTRAAVCSVIPGFSAGVPLSVSMRTTTGEDARTNLAESDLIALAPSCSVAFASVVDSAAASAMSNQTVSLSSVMGQTAIFGADPTAHTSGLTRSILGPVMSEFHYYCKTTDRDLRVWWFVRLYSDDRIEIETRVTNGWLMESATHRQLGYTATVTINGSSRFSGAVTHIPWAQWSRVDWYGTDPAVLVTLARSQFVAAQVVAPYVDSAIPSGQVAALHNATRSGAYGPTPMDRGAFPTGWGSGGESATDNLGLLNYTSAAAMTTGTEATLYAALAQDRMHGRYPVLYIDPATGRAPLMSGKTTVSLGTNTGLWYGDPGGAIASNDAVPTDQKWDLEHNIEAHWLSFLAEGRWSSVDAAQNYAMACLLAVHPTYREGALFRYNGGTERGEAWGLRTAVTALMSTPAFDTAMHAELVGIVEDNVAHYYTNGLVDNYNELGIVAKLAPAGSTPSAPFDVGFWGRSWMSDFLSAVLGFSATANLPLASGSVTNLLAVAKHSLKHVVGLFGDASGWNYRQANYTLYAGPGGSPTSDIKLGDGSPTTYPPTVWYTWAEAYSRTQAAMASYGALAASAESGQSLLYDMSGGALSDILGGGSGTYYAMRIPALSYAVDLSVTGADLAYQRLYSTPTSMDLSSYPRYSVEPINAPAVTPAAGTATIVATRADFLACKPGMFSAGEWTQVWFGGYGSGVYNPHMGAAGSTMAAGFAGHATPQCYGVLRFDWDTHAWSYTACPDQADHLMAATPGLAELSGLPWCEILSSGVPAGSHTYRSQMILSPANGGGTYGSILQVCLSAAGNAGTAHGNRAHLCDPTTAEWTRVRPDSATSFVYEKIESTTVYDPVDNRYYYLSYTIHSFNYIEYLDGDDLLIKRTPTFPYTPTPGGAAYGTSFLHGRYIVFSWGGSMRAISLDNITAGWQMLTVSGSVPSTGDAWVYHPTLNKHYLRTMVQGQNLWRLTPPADPLTGTWVCDEITLTGDAIFEGSDNPSGAPIATGPYTYRWLQYISEIDCLGWVTYNGVNRIDPT